MSIRETLRLCLTLLNGRDRRLLLLATTLQMAFSLLDLIGVLLVGLAGALAIAVVQGAAPPVAASTMLDAVGLSDATAQEALSLVAGLAATLLLGKSILASLSMRRVLRFLARRQAVVATQLASDLLAMPLSFIQGKSSQQLAYALTEGSRAATTTILGQGVVGASEASLLALLAGGLLIVNPPLALLTLFFFAFVAVGIHLALGSWASRVGQATATADIASLDAIQEATSAYRELTVLGRRGFYVARLGSLRSAAAEASADLNFNGIFPKYMYEGALVVGAFGLAAYLFATEGLTAATGTLALFLAAGTRILPSLIRLQGSILAIRNTSPIASTALNLSDEIRRADGRPVSNLIDSSILSADPPDIESFVPDIRLHDVSYTYPGRNKPAIASVTLDIRAGQTVALVGSSGAGKSTLVDILLNVHMPQSGQVWLGGMSPLQVMQVWPGAIAYVPQHVALANASIRSNVALGLDPGAIDDDAVLRALERAQLGDLLRDAGMGLDLQVGERGVRLSGGQRQRLGIARALYTDPKILVLDEATSSLDADTESAITDLISRLDATITTVVVAHRLSTIRDVDVIYYLERGEVVAYGTFSELKSWVPAFRRQARAMGL